MMSFGAVVGITDVYCRVSLPLIASSAMVSFWKSTPALFENVCLGKVIKESVLN